MKTILSLEFNNKKYGIKIHKNLKEKSVGYKRKVFGSFTFEYNFPYLTTRLDKRIEKIHKKSIKNYITIDGEIKRDSDYYERLMRIANENTLNLRKMETEVIKKLLEPEAKKED